MGSEGGRFASVRARGNVRAVSRRAGRHPWQLRYRCLLTGAVCAIWLVAIASQGVHESGASFGTQMSHVAAVATIAWLPLSFPRLTIRLLGVTLVLGLFGAGVSASRSGRR
jgi:hypothetical protein